MPKRIRTHIMFDFIPDSHLLRLILAEQARGF